MNEFRFNELLECVRQLKDNHETYDSLKAKVRDLVKVQIDLLGIISADDESVDSIMKAFEILKKNSNAS